MKKFKFSLLVIILIANFAGQAQTSKQDTLKKPTKSVIKLDILYGLNYSTKYLDYHNNIKSLGYDWGLNFNWDSTQLASIYLCYSYNEFENSYKSTNIYFGWINPITLVNRLDVYNNTYVSFIIEAKKLKMGLYEGIGFQFYNMDRIELGVIFTNIPQLKLSYIWKLNFK